VLSSRSHLVPQVVVLVSVLQRRGPVLLPLLHLPVEHVHGAAGRRQPSAGLPPRPGPRAAAGGRGGRRRGAGGPQEPPTHTAAHRSVLWGPDIGGELINKCRERHWVDFFFLSYTRSWPPGGGGGKTWSWILPGSLETMELDHRPDVDWRCNYVLLSHNNSTNTCRDVFRVLWNDIFHLYLN